MAKTIEDLDLEYERRRKMAKTTENLEEDINYLNQQAVLGTKEEADEAYDECGKFHCINWFDCSHCPAFNAKYCL